MSCIIIGMAGRRKNPNTSVRRKPTNWSKVAQSTPTPSKFVQDNDCSSQSGSIKNIHQKSASEDNVECDKTMFKLTPEDPALATNASSQKSEPSLPTTPRGSGRKRKMSRKALEAAETAFIFVDNSSERGIVSGHTPVRTVHNKDRKPLADQCANVAKSNQQDAVACARGKENEVQGKLFPSLKLTGLKNTALTQYFKPHSHSGKSLMAGAVPQAKSALFPMRSSTTLEDSNRDRRDPRATGNIQKPRIRTTEGTTGVEELDRLRQETEMLKKMQDTMEKERKDLQRQIAALRCDKNVSPCDL